MSLVVWDIENIGYTYIKKELHNFEDFKKIIIHNNKFCPMKENQKNHLINKKWEFKLVKPGKNSADYALIDYLENNIPNYTNFHIITGDKGFSGIIVLLLKLHKKVTLYLKEDHIEKLSNHIYAGLPNYAFANLTVKQI